MGIGTRVRGDDAEGDGKEGGMLFFFLFFLPLYLRSSLPTLGWMTNTSFGNSGNTQDR